MKRTLTALTAALLFAASGVAAETPAAPAKPVASPFSPLVYEALGATPKIGLRKAEKGDATPAAQKAGTLRSGAPADAGATSHPAVPATATAH